MQAALPHARGFVLMLAGECPLCGAGRLEDGAPATHVRYAVKVQHR